MIIDCKKYEAVIGLEIHAELKTQSKMFCSCANSTTRIDTNYGLNATSFTSEESWPLGEATSQEAHKPHTNKDELRLVEPNWNICPVCLGMPGMLPVLNKQAIEWTILTGLALNCKIAEFTKWDRKNYFYPDLPKGYQISQYDLPICSGGYLKVNDSYRKLRDVKDSSKQPSLTSEATLTSINQRSDINHRIGITRIHLEEDTGTSKHPEGRADIDYSLMDYNRAGVPLMELVTDAITLPIDQAGKIAKEFCQKYQLILRYLKVADADMEKGQMRCEVNISLREITRMDANKEHELTPNKLGTKVEIKNLNSFKSVEKAIEYEIERQSESLDRGEKIIQETRGWNDAKGKTYTMRVKETSADYRYFPEPDLPAIRLARGTMRTKKSTRNYADEKFINIDEIKKQLPETIEETMERYLKLGLSYDEAELIIYDLQRSKLFDEAVVLYKNLAKELAIWIINDIKDFCIKPDYLVELIQLVKDSKISKSVAKEILSEVYKGKSPSAIIKDKGLEQVSDQNVIKKIIDKVLSQNSAIVAKIKSGKPEAIGFLVGQVMRESKGQANPQVVNEILKRKIR